jgi:hypothetical protein
VRGLVLLSCVCNIQFTLGALIRRHCTRVLQWRVPPPPHTHTHTCTTAHAHHRSLLSLIVDTARATPCRYALLSTVRADTRYSSSPGGLATNSYNGHTFWDVETWMWPLWLTFHPDIAKAVLQYRADRRTEVRRSCSILSLTQLELLVVIRMHSPPNAERDPNAAAFFESCSLPASICV